jgi:chemotaxis protein MotB
MQSPLESIAWYAWQTEESESNWLLTYVDMLSVLLAMLVVLLGHMAVERMKVEAPDDLASELKPVTEVVRQTENSSKPVTPNLTRQKRDSAPNSRLVNAIEEQFQNQIRIIQRDTGLSLEIADTILFRSANAELLPGATPVLTRLATILMTIGDVDIAVEGHTDDRPIHGGRYRSNWELAAARANAVTAFLLEQGINAARLRSVSYADTHPVADNRTETGRAKNRRVNIRVDYL